jgi:hypothetical protein
MTWVLYALLLTKSLDLPLLFSPSIMYNCLDNIMLVAQDLMQVIFEDMDPVWLKSMWESGGTSRAKMIEIIIMLALLKHMLKQLLMGCNI